MPSSRARNERPAHIPLVVATVDTALRYTWIFDPHPDFTPEAVLGKRDDELASTPGIAALVDLKQRVLGSGRAEYRDITFDLSDGVHEYGITATPLYGRGSVIGVATVALDHTVHQRWVRQLMGNASDPFEVIQAESQRLGHLIANLLDVAALQGGRLELRRAPVDLAEVAAEAIDAARRLSDEHSIELRRPESPIIGVWDSVRIRQVFEHLLGTAIHYSPGGGEILLSLERRDRDAVVQLRDHRLGVRGEEVSQLFQQFSASRLADAVGTSGLGLGLYISRSLVRAHGGEMYFHPAPDTRASLSFELPLRPVPPL